MTARILIFLAAFMFSIAGRCEDSKGVFKIVDGFNVAQSSKVCSEYLDAKNEAYNKTTTYQEYLRAFHENNMEEQIALLNKLHSLSNFAGASALVGIYLDNPQYQNRELAEKIALDSVSNGDGRVYFYLFRMSLDKNEPLDALRYLKIGAELCDSMSLYFLAKGYSYGTILNKIVLTKDLDLAKRLFGMIWFNPYADERSQILASNGWFKAALEYAVEKTPEIRRWSFERKIKVYTKGEENINNYAWSKANPNIGAGDVLWISCNDQQIYDSLALVASIANSRYSGRFNFDRTDAFCLRFIGTYIHKKTNLDKELTRTAQNNLVLFDRPGGVDYSYKRILFGDQDFDGNANLYFLIGPNNKKGFGIETHVQLLGQNNATGKVENYIDVNFWCLGYKGGMYAGECEQSNLPDTGMYE